MNLNQALLILSATIMWFVITFVLMHRADELGNRYLIGHIMLYVGLFVLFTFAWLGIAALYVMLGD